MTAFERVVDAFRRDGLNVKDNGHGKASAQAPGHSAADLSVSITDIGGQVLVHSHGDPTAEVLDRMGLSMADLFDSPKGAEYRYSDGRTVHRTPDKKFRQSGNTKGRALFNVESVKPGGTVFVTEGEKCALAIKSAGGIAVSPAMGAGKASQFDWTPLHGCNVVVVADKDEPGRRHAADVQNLLSSIAKSVRIVEAKAGKDAADHIAAGHGVADFISVELGTSPADDSEDIKSTPSRRLKVTRGADVKMQRVTWVMPDWIPAGSLTLLAGREGLGKSTIACDMAARITRGTLDGALNGTAHNILYVHSEDSREFTVAPRLKAAGADMNRVLFVDVQTDFTDSGTVVLPLDTIALEQVIVEHDVAFVVLDAATSSMSSELSGKDDRAVRQFLEPLAQLAARRDCAVLGLCHFGKRDGADTGKLILGSIAWSQVARSVLSLAKDDETGNLVCTNTKGNLAPRVRSMDLQLTSAAVDTDDGPAEVGTITWLGESSRDARDLLEGPGDDHDDRTAAERWLQGYLEEQGQTAAARIKDDARKEERISTATLKRAAKSLGVVYTIQGRNTFWSLPTDPAHTMSREPSEPSEPYPSDQGEPRTETVSNANTAHVAHGSVHEPGEPDQFTECQICDQTLMFPGSRETGICGACDLSQRRAQRGQEKTA